MSILDGIEVREIRFSSNDSFSCRIYIDKHAVADIECVNRECSVQQIRYYVNEYLELLDNPEIFDAIKKYVALRRNLLQIQRKGLVFAKDNTTTVVSVMFGSVSKAMMNPDGRRDIKEEVRRMRANGWELLSTNVNV